MKRLAALTTLLIATLANAASSIPVYLDPDDDAKQIGELEALSLAVPAEWPKGTEFQEGWQPVYYRGVFDVYVDNNDIGKDLTAKPGSLYLLSPDKNAPKLAIATARDEAHIISVDTWFCKMRLETIVLAFIPNTSTEASSILTSLPHAASLATAVESTETSFTELVGRLEKTGMLGRNRTGADFKLTGPTGKTLAFLDTSEVPERIHLDDFLNIEIRVSGFLKQKEGENDVILQAKTLKKAF